MKARKENKVYRISTEQEKQRYLRDGYDIYSDEGKLIEYSPQRKISLSEYETLAEENESLKEANESLRRVEETQQKTDAVKDEVKTTGAKAGK